MSGDAPKGLSGLMKYRFQKREEDKVAPTSPTFNARIKTNSTSPQSSTPSNDTSARSSPHSPVFNGIKKTPPNPNKGQNHSTNADTSSTWLSKTSAKTQSVPASESSQTSSSQSLESGNSSSWSVNGSQTSSQSQTSSSSQSQTGSSSQSQTVSSSQSSNQLTDEDRQIYSDISSLQSMFPHRSREDAADCLRFAGNDLDKAIDNMMNPGSQYNKQRGEKRARHRSSLDSGGCRSSPESSPVKRVWKRARILSSGDEDDVSQNAAGQSSQEGGANSDAITFLKEAFPSLDEQILQDVLNKFDGNTEKATTALADMCSEKSQQPVNKKGTRSSYSGEQCALGSGDEWDEYEEISSSDDEMEVDVGQRGVLLRFMNESGMSDLLSIAGCSKKKAECLMQIRPFSSYDDMVSKLRDNKSVSADLITQCKELLRIRQIVQSLMKKCEKLSRELESVISELTSKTTTQELGESDREYISKQPNILTQSLQLTQYQIVGLNWLVIMHEQELDGILGDEMGLGKTIQTIAFLAYMKEKEIHGPHLIVAPSSTLDNWLRELRVWCPSLRVLLYYGSVDERYQLRRQLLSDSGEEYDVVLTTYQMTTGTTEDRNLFKKNPWHYAVFDEGHMLKNMTSIRYRTLMKINADRRLLLTGTPLQNNLIELMSLLAFVMPDLFTSKTEHLKRIFASMTGKSGDENRSAYEAENVAHAQQILKPFFLRRLKTEVLKQLPRKTEESHYVPMVPDQRQNYMDLKDKFTETMKKFSGVTAPGNSGSAMLMQLRKAANHPLLHRQHYTLDILRKMARDMLKEPTHTESVEQYVYEDMEVMSDYELHRLSKQYRSLHKYQLDNSLILNSGKFRYLDELLPKLKEKQSRVLLFSQFTMILDIIETYMDLRNHKFLRLDGSTPVPERLALIDQYTNDPSIFVFLLSTKAGGLGINLTAANVVIMHDIDFNPYNDKQAEDRCHRLGQKQDVIVHRLLSAGTIEEGMWKCAQAKLRLEQDITGQGPGDKVEANDVASLLKEALSMDSAKTNS